MIFAVWDAAIAATVSGIASAVVGLVSSGIGLWAKFVAAQAHSEAVRAQVDQDRLDKGLAYEREQRIAERNETNARLWKMEQDLLGCEKGRARLQALYDELSSSHRPASESK